MRNESTIYLDEWLEAEKQCSEERPQPEKSVTVAQYAEARGFSTEGARRILARMFAKGIAHRERWKGKHIYFINKKGIKNK